MNSLQVVQLANKIMKILTLIGMIFSFIGAAFALIGGSVLLTMPELLGNDVMDMFMEIPELKDFDMKSAAMTAIAGAIVSVAQGVVLMFGHGYFKRAEEDGTPFTHDGAKQLFVLGIITLAIPLGALIIVGIISAISGADVNLDNTVELGIGIGMILLSKVYDYGATLEDKVKAIENETNTSEN